MVRRVISQSVLLPASAEALFDMYLNADEHGAITGAPVRIDRALGSDFSAFEGMLSGTMLALVSPCLIIQSWRSAKFNPTDPDSTLILNFKPEADGGRIDLVHLDVPDHDYDGVNEGWTKFYWTPWREYLARKVE